MKELKLRFAEPNESETILEWLHANPHNRFDASILKYPTLRVLSSYDEDGAVCYLPVHKSLVFESIALRPGVNALTSALALHDLTKAAELLASVDGIKEIRFEEGAAGVRKMALNHGFSEMPWNTLRMVL